MLTKVLTHARGNAVAYLALFCAVGGTSYAAVSLPVGSVGSRQLQNHSIAPVKFDPGFINGNIRAFVVANANGTVQASSGRPTVTVTNGQGVYNVTWRVSASPRPRCFAVGGLTSAPGQVAVVANLGFDHHKPRPRKVWGVDVNTFGAQGQPLAQSFYTALVC